MVKVEEILDKFSSEIESTELLQQIPTKCIRCGEALYATDMLTEIVCNKKECERERRVEKILTQKQLKVSDSLRRKLNSFGNAEEFERIYDMQKYLTVEEVQDLKWLLSAIKSKKEYTLNEYLGIFTDTVLLTTEILLKLDVESLDGLYSKLTTIPEFLATLGIEDDVESIEYLCWYLKVLEERDSIYRGVKYITLNEGEIKPCIVFVGTWEQNHVEQVLQKNNMRVYGGELRGVNDRELLLQMVKTPELVLVYIQEEYEVVKYLEEKKVKVKKWRREVDGAKS